MVFLTGNTRCFISVDIIKMLVKGFKPNKRLVEQCFSQLVYISSWGDTAPLPLYLLFKVYKSLNFLRVHKYLTSFLDIKIINALIKK
ncbi:hypothetical protein BKK54_08685 [Rodentibacter genomosp. 1]|uniref:Uncharacterized protein n=1 Tax=Rodentibacter genomosp. 1 TaxID=1908264 RepID=A0A1V3J3V8_9PAST|nr:hypothetical protein BKK54_08685 [Rodentibacter genomosp. 1]